MNLISGAISDTGRIRPGNEDAIGCFPELRLFAVADGMGGHAHGEIASRLAIETLRDSIRSELGKASPPQGRRARAAQWLARGRRAKQATVSAEDILCSAIRRANLRIYAEGRARADETARASLGTTIVALLFDRESTTAAFAHVGDSRLYHKRGDQMRLLTADHTLYGQPYWGSSDVPLDVQHTNQLLEALGPAEEVRVSSATIPVHGGDLFVLCSDGLSGSLPPEELQAALLGSDDLDGLCLDLVRRANEAGGRDNISVVAVRATIGE